MQFKSTRNQDNIVTASQAIVQGLATDGGLYVPTEWPSIDLDWSELKEMTYQELAYFVMSIFFDDFSEADLKSCIDGAYDEKFDTDVIAPLAKVGEDYYLELFHGPTIAFKDLALQILPHLMKKSAEMNWMFSAAKSARKASSLNKRFTSVCASSKFPSIATTNVLSPFCVTICFS